MLTTPAEFSAFEGGTGQYRSQSITDALLLGESDVEGWLETFLVPTAQTEEFIWPVDNGLIMLKKVRTISVDAVVAIHSLDCSCQWTTATDCAVILNARHSVIRVVDCNGQVGKCFGACRCPQRVRVTYTAGFTAAQALATTPDGMKLHAGVYNAALAHLQTTIGLDAMGDRAVGSWSSAGYSESSQFNERSGAEEMIHPLTQQAKNLVRKLIIKRAPGLRVAKGIVVST